MKKPHLNSEEGRAVFRHINATAHRTGLTVHNVALRYALERFLHRIFESRDPETTRLLFNPDSEFRIDPSSITLKGGLTLTFAEGVPPHEGRSTGDADLHLAAFRGGMPEYAELLRRILSAPSTSGDDGVRFDVDAIAVSRDREERSGGSVVVPLQIGLLWLQIKTDVTLDARPMHDRAPVSLYPSIVPETGMAPAIVRRVPWEFMLSDKIGAAFENGMLNKRIRDYGDMRLILGSQSIDVDYLAQTLAGTMRFKDMSLPASIDTAAGFSDAFALAKAERWEHERVAKRFQVTDALPVIMPWLRDHLRPVVELAHETDPLPVWSRGPR